MRKLFTAIVFICLVSASVNAETIYNNLQQTALKAGVTAEVAASLSKRTESAGFTESDIRQAQNIISSMYQAGAQNAAEKILEGIAKNIDPARINMALNRVQARHTEAMQIARMIGATPEKTEQLAEITAEAMAAGANSRKLTSLAEEISKKEDKEAYAEAVYALYRDMVRTGVEDAKTYRVAEKMMHNFSSEEINKMKMQFNSSASHTDPSEMANRMESNAASGSMGGMGSSGSGAGGMNDSGSGSGMGGMGGSGGSGSGGNSGGNGGGKR